MHRVLLHKSLQLKLKDINLTYACNENARVLSLSFTLSLSLLYAGHKKGNVSWLTSLRYVSQCRSRNATGRFKPSDVQLIITLFQFWSYALHSLPLVPFLQAPPPVVTWAGKCRRGWDLYFLSLNVLGVLYWIEMEELVASFLVRCQMMSV